MERTKIDKRAFFNVAGACLKLTPKKHDESPLLFNSAVSTTPPRRGAPTALDQLL